jgi:HD superfamily phosphodiesterase
MQDRPNVDELLAAVAGFLHDDVMPNTTGRLSFHARVAGNVIEMLRRELANEEQHLNAECEGLETLLGAAPRPAALSELRATIIARNTTLAERIRAGEMDAEPAHSHVLAHLRATTRDKIAVSNPNLLAQQPG